MTVGWADTSHLHFSCILSQGSLTSLSGPCPCLIFIYAGPLESCSFWNPALDVSSPFFSPLTLTSYYPWFQTADVYDYHSLYKRTIVLLRIYFSFALALLPAFMLQRPSCWSSALGHHLFSFVSWSLWGAGEASSSHTHCTLVQMGTFHAVWWCTCMLSHESSHNHLQFTSSIPFSMPLLYNSVLVTEITAVGGLCQGLCFLNCQLPFKCLAVSHKCLYNALLLWCLNIFFLFRFLLWILYVISLSFLLCFISGYLYPRQKIQLMSFTNDTWVCVCISYLSSPAPMNGLLYFSGLTQVPGKLCMVKTHLCILSFFLICVSNSGIIFGCLRVPPACIF